jgi:FkbM family methyltransferase
MVLLNLRGRVRHSDRFGLSYWLWERTRAMAIPMNHPATDDTGVFEQMEQLYALNSQAGQKCISVDAGAYIGIVSQAMERFGPAKHIVHSFEADDLNFAMLSENVSQFSTDQITTHKTALGNYVGSAEFTRTPDTGTNHLGVETDSPTANTIVYKVPITTLDEFTSGEEFDVIKVLKIDVEGTDLDVLRGAEGLLADGRIEVIIVEIPLSAERRSEMNTYLTEQGLSIAYIVRNSKDLKPAEESVYTESERAPLNMLAVRSDLASQLGI